MRHRRAFAAVALTLALLAGQAAAAPTRAVWGSDAAAVLGRTGFAYIGGLRTFAAAVLWNRLEPQFHRYYASNRLEDQVQMLPTIRVVMWLDPQFVQAYYIVPYLLTLRGDFVQGESLAREGIRNNPTAGILRASYIQILQYRNKVAYRDEMVALAREGMQPQMRYATGDELYEALAVYRIVFKSAGDTASADRIAKILADMKAKGIGQSVDHDHDGDGKPDH